MTEAKSNSHFLLSTLAFTGLALTAFAANSVLCRAALGAEAIDAVSFTTIRVLSGSVTLLFLALFQTPFRQLKTGGSWAGAFCLFLYASTFSFAYMTLDTGTGALILFGAVQLTIVAASLTRGETVDWLEWLGLLLSLAGFVYLVSPGLSVPTIKGLGLMGIAGMAWGFYTLIGRGSTKALLDTAMNFTRALPFILVLMLCSVTIGGVAVSKKGLLLAIASGALSSGIGYAIWYRALQGLSSLQSGVVQLSVPVIAAGGGIVFVGEQFSWRLSIASFLILGGIFAVFLGRQRLAKMNSREDPESEETDS